MAKACKLHGVKVWSYCLMPNHIHLIAVPNCEKGLAKAIGYGHESYTRYINFKMGWRGYLWQGRFSSYPMDESHLFNAARYIELNPVMGKIVANPVDYRWSSIHAHLDSESTDWIDPEPLLSRVSNWQEFINEGITHVTIKLLEKHQRTGRPLGSLSFLKDLEKQTGLDLIPKKPGRKPNIPNRGTHDLIG